MHAVHACVVARGDAVKLGEVNLVIEGAELDSGVAEDVRIGSSTCAYFCHTMLHHTSPILFREVDHTQLHADLEEVDRI